MRVPSIAKGVGVKVLVGFCVRVGVSFVGVVVAIGIESLLLLPQPTNAMDKMHNAIIV